jgi:hypothetical protein
VQVTVQKIWPLDPTKKSGGFKATDGYNYYCEIGAYHLLQEGATYEANPKPYVAKSTGKTSYIMPKDWHPPATGGNGGTTKYGDAEDNRIQPPPPPRPAANGAAPPYFSEAEKSGYIFVTGCLQQALGAGKIEAKDIPTVAQMLVDTWTNYIRGKV